MLPIGSIILGLVALVLGGFALAQASKANKLLTEQQVKIDKIDSVEQQAANAAAAAEKGAQNLKAFGEQTQTAFNQVSTILGNLQNSVTKLEESAKRPAAAAGGKKGASTPAVAGPDEYIVKAGDVSGAKIARDNGVSLADLQAVNPGVNWTKLHIGQKLKLPAKR